MTLTNVLTDDTGRLTGIVDLGDVHHTAAVCDLAATLTSVLRNTAPAQTTELWALAAAVLRGYQRHRPLTPGEADVLGELVIARLALTLAVSATRAQVRRRPLQAHPARRVLHREGRQHGPGKDAAVDMQWPGGGGRDPRCQE